MTDITLMKIQLEGMLLLKRRQSNIKCTAFRCLSCLTYLRNIHCSCTRTVVYKLYSLYLFFFTTLTNCSWHTNPTFWWMLVLGASCSLHSGKNCSCGTEKCSLQVCSFILVSLTADFYSPVKYWCCSWHLQLSFWKNNTFKNAYQQRFFFFCKTSNNLWCSDIWKIKRKWLKIQLMFKLVGCCSWLLVGSSL